MATEIKDFLLDTNRELLIQNGDFVLGNSEQQDAQSVLLHHKGSFKEFPFRGVGIRSYLNGSGTDQDLRRAINIELQALSLKIENIEIDEDNIIWIDAKRV